MPEVSLPGGPAPATFRPLLTIAVPTYNRAAELTQLLTLLEPQLRDHPEVDLYLSDNASQDDTAKVVERFLACGLRLRYQRHPENIGSDANFISCFHAARGIYFWLFGDDDLILPGTIDQVLQHLADPAQPVDIIFASSYGFRNDYLAERRTDPLHRRVHTITSALQLARVANIMFTFISGIIVNRDRLLDLPRATGLSIEDPSAFAGTNLTQLSWTLPLLRAHRRSLVLWNRPVAGRQANSGGYSIGHVFGERLVSACNRLLPDHPELARSITDFAIRRWFPGSIYEIRCSPGQSFLLDQAQAALRQTYGRNFRFWLFAYPVLKLPLPLARLWVLAGTAISRLVYVLLVPGFWRRQT